MDPEYLRELFSSFRPVDLRRMFSGVGIFAEGLMFGLVVDQVVYLKCSEENAADFECESLPPFEFHARGGRRVLTSYRRMPERLYDDPEELSQWASKALQVATRKARQKAMPAPAKSVRKKPIRKKAAVKKAGRGTRLA